MNQKIVYIFNMVLISLLLTLPILSNKEIKKVSTDSIQIESSPRPIIEAVHITLGDYFADRSNDNIYRVGFMLNDTNLKEDVTVKITYSLNENEQWKVDDDGKFTKFSFL